MSGHQPLQGALAGVVLHEAVQRAPLGRGRIHTMSYETILFEVADRIASITFNRPDRLNAINQQMIAELNDAYSRAEGDDDVWTLIVTGAGRAFCSGADVEKIPEDGKAPHVGRYLSQYKQWEAPQEATPPFRSMAKPIVVAVNGICAGAGMDLVTTGDITIASDDAEFFDPHVSIGLVGGREMVRVARALPINVAMRMALVGKHERLSAAACIRTRFHHRGRAARGASPSCPRSGRDGQSQRAARRPRSATGDSQRARPPAPRGGDARGGVPRAGPPHGGLARRTARLHGAP